MDEIYRAHLEEGDFGSYTEMRMTKSVHDKSQILSARPSMELSIIYRTIPGPVTMFDAVDQTPYAGGDAVVPSTTR